MSDSTLKPPAAVAPNRLQLPTANSMSAPITAPQKLIASSGSATGNPRNKCALKPGYSLMSWIRLCNSGADLSGTAGRVLPVSAEQLAQHNKVDDAWLAIRGKVFNVTRYMDFHPGGIEELMRGVGRDATKLFDEVHAWVNYPQLLGKCYVGPLQQSSQQSKPSAQQLVKSLPPPAPRFDWMQQRTELTLILYTRQFANPGLLLRRRSAQVLELQLQLSQNWHLYEFEMAGPVQWPPKAVRLNSETGKVEIVLIKTSPAPWLTYGAHKHSQLDAISVGEQRLDFELKQRLDFNHNSFELCLQSVEQQLLMLPPVGYHIAIEMSSEAGEAIQRSYTPVAARYLSSASDVDVEFPLGFLIKRYAEGQMSSRLQQLQTGAIVQLSLPRGNFQLQALAKHRHILLLAAGSGLTPMLSLLQPLLQRQTNRIERLHLLCFNKTQADIWLEEPLQALQSTDERFSHAHILSEEEGKQRLSLELLTPLLEQRGAEGFGFIAICGSDGFNAAALDILKQLQFQLNQVHVFQG